ncbi:flagellar hook-associated protein FlgK [Cellulomonas aerilata]|uniref:Flagellar hook-associated protein 1 n=1 Tax=Cellulomonas aerilata TaxID=515326 RepID=A0A512DEE6_9CELL|nr:flagellar hook-associated protein FlgK [Cellulomonas aerilata]GEO34826.1 flagellar hook-associated protein 1 [Cellulomonas aerilata]
MSSFSGLSTALSSLNAQRQALEVSGQNVANANTVGYTRQRADMTSTAAQSAPSLFSGSGTAAGSGLRISSVARLGDVFLDARVRSETGSASFAATRAEVYARLESTVAEPSDLGVSHALSTFWASWQDVGNSPDSAPSRAVLLESATALAERISSGYGAIATQWTQARTELTTALDDVNTTADGVALLNQQIRGVLTSGGSANELVDQRNVLVTSLSRLVGATATERQDGTMDVMLGGNALVRGDVSHAISIVDGSARTLETADAGVRLQWQGTGTPLGTASGQVMGLVSALAGADDGGILARAARSYDDTAQTLMGTVNAVHKDSFTRGLGGAPGVAGGDVFTTGGSPAAKYLKVALVDGAQFAVSARPDAPLDGSRADAMARLQTADGGLDEKSLPTVRGADTTWSSFVVRLGVEARGADQRAVVSESTRATAEKLQLSGASVDIDEESVNMLAYQRAYEGAARVLTAIDEMLDTLINRTGVVGR